MEMDQIITDLLRLLAGTGVFLMACEIMSKNLEAISSDKLKSLFSKVSGNKLVGVMIGALATVAIQSSGATTVMTIGFVNAGIITLSQAATIIFGGEIGTTITGQIVALGMFGSGNFDVNVLFSSLAGIGVFTNMFAKSEKKKLLGYVLAGLGMLFVGLNMMSTSMRGFAQTEGLKTFLAGIDSVILLIVIGAILTAIIQSSSAITSIAITMVVTGLIDLNQGIYLTLGANVGTCLTGLLAGMKTESLNARRASLIQLIFNIGGVVLVTVLDMIIKMASGNSLSFSIMFEHMFPGIPHTQLAMFHTIFNIASVILVLPISDFLVGLTKKFIPDDGSEISKQRFYFVDENMIATPAIAVQQVKKEIINMAMIAITNFDLAIEMILSGDLSKQELLQDNEAELNFLNHHLVEIVVKLTRKEAISKKDYYFLSSTYRVISDIERIGDYSINIMEYAQNLQESGESFSDEAKGEILQLQKLINDLYQITMQIYGSNKRKLMKNAYKLEDKIDEMTHAMAKNHVKRLNKGECTANLGAQYLKLSSDAERIGDHLININDKDNVSTH
ncbi:MAG: Na/Pi cotransporter family protein [Erysipelotrichaceae bacterium]|nr:Na/Pi cotransporter family protein [Erysipelotrichaceae bacterium]